MNAPAKNSVSKVTPATEAEASARHLHAADLHGIARLALLVVDVIIERVEALHARLSGSGVTYRRARATTVTAGRWFDSALAPPRHAARPLSSGEREAVLSALNGLFGDLLARTGNPLAIRMRLRQHGVPLQLDKAALAAALPAASGKLLILVHGLCRSDLQWRRGGHDHGAALARELGYTPLYLHYNSGRHVSVNGREFAALMEQLVAQWPLPVEEIAILGHSMGGLVTRSACHYARAARHAWPARLRHIIFLGTPHHGAPLERHGNWLGALLGRSTLTAPFARLGELRSAGITDLRYGNLVDEDWQGRDRFEHSGDLRRKIPLPRAVRCYAIAGCTGRRLDDIRTRLLGDGLVPLDTALGRHAERTRTLAFPASRQWIAFGIHHLDLLSRIEVYEKIRSWLAAPPRRPAAVKAADASAAPARRGGRKAGTAKAGN